jgi:hypothetical protein
MYISPEELDLSACWCRVPVARIWPAELFPILDADAHLQSILEDTVADWVADTRLAKQFKRKPWRYADKNAMSPFEMTESDAAFTDVMEEIDVSEEAEAYAHRAIDTLLCLADDLDIPESLLRSLSRYQDRLYKGMWPDRTDIRWVRPYHSCHSFNSHFALCLATAWRPKAGWKILRGDFHTTIVSPREHLIFDLLLLDETQDMAPLLFALGIRHGRYLEKSKDENIAA